MRSHKHYDWGTGNTDLNRNLAGNGNVDLNLNRCSFGNRPGADRHTSRRGHIFSSVDGHKRRADATAAPAAIDTAAASAAADDTRGPVKAD